MIASYAVFTFVLLRLIEAMPDGERNGLPPRLIEAPLRVSSVRLPPGVVNHAQDTLICVNV